MKLGSGRLWAGGIFATLLLAACGGSAPYEAEMPPCWVYKGLSEEEIARMEAWCNEYAVCSREDGEACAGPTEAAAQ